MTCGLYLKKKKTTCLYKVNRVDKKGRLPYLKFYCNNKEEILSHWSLSSSEKKAEIIPLCGMLGRKLFP